MPFDEKAFLTAIKEEKLAEAISMLVQSQMMTLDLSCNDLHKLTERQWVVFGGALEKSRGTILNLKWNDLHQLTEQQWTEFGTALATSHVINVTG
ncbi:hypothetical protein LCGC14_1216480, partial [marine sediment metagenome]